MVKKTSSEKKGSVEGKTGKLKDLVVAMIKI